MHFSGVQTVISYLLMLGAGAVCLSVACLSKSSVGIITSGVMLAAMADHALNNWVPAAVWAALLLICGVMLAVRIRFERAVCGPTDAVSGNEQSGFVALTSVLTALAFPVMAWFVLSGHRANASATGMSHIAPGSMHAHGSVDALTTLVLMVAASLGLTFMVVAAIAARRKRSAHTADAGGMALMLFGALLPFISF